MPIVASVQDAHVFRVRVRASCEVSGRAIDGLDSDLSRPVQLRRVRVPRSFALPVIEDAGRIFPLPMSVRSDLSGRRLTRDLSEDRGRRRVRIGRGGDRSADDDRVGARTNRSGRRRDADLILDRKSVV